MTRVPTRLLKKRGQLHDPWVMQLIPYKAKTGLEPRLHRYLIFRIFVRLVLLSVSMIPAIGGSAPVGRSCPNSEGQQWCLDLTFEFIAKPQSHKAQHNNGKAPEYDWEG